MIVMMVKIDSGYLHTVTVCSVTVSGVAAPRAAQVRIPQAYCISSRDTRHEEDTDRVLYTRWTNRTALCRHHIPQVSR